MAGHKWILFFTVLLLFTLACTGYTVTICEYRKTTIRCRLGTIIKVFKASYGRHDRSTCPHQSIGTTSCHAASSLSRVKNTCDDRPGCELFASNSVFGDPCRGTYKYLRVTYSCNLPMVKSIVICENHSSILRCPSGKKITGLLASYGRHDRSTCPSPSIRTTNCHARNSVPIVSAICNNKPSCSLFASNSVFGDPCVGTYKYLEVKYQCTV